ncbi:hypothetical protein, partial [Streptomyces sp. NPDC026589]|uniref:hypothetical protein n=1 Tax=Streptomyces sp. NPDC026589 TaxID=3155609 RepID=UPI0033E35DDB
SQTAWALLALLAAGRRDTRPVARGVTWLTEARTPTGILRAGTPAGPTGRRGLPGRAAGGPGSAPGSSR